MNAASVLVLAALFAAKAGAPPSKAPKKEAPKSAAKAAPDAGVAAADAAGPAPEPDKGSDPLDAGSPAAEGKADAGAASVDGGKAAAKPEDAGKAVTADAAVVSAGDAGNADAKAPDAAVTATADAAAAMTDAAVTAAPDAGAAMTEEKSADAGASVAAAESPDAGAPAAPVGPSRALLIALFPPYKDAGPKPKDGSQAIDYAGPGDAQLKISQDYMRQRDALLAIVEKPVSELVATAKLLDTAEDEEARSEIRRKMTELSRKPLDEAHGKLAEALKLEDRRIFMVRKALELASERGKRIPEVDPDLVQRLYLNITSNMSSKAADRRIQAYRNLVSGIIAFLDGDVLTSLARIKLVTEDAPDLALAHVYLGSLCFLVQQPEQAITSWKKALELDPSNEAVRKALREHAATAKGMNPR